ncbi:MAG: hypothetical protein E7318_09750 [Clostridiales bacterium]|nr:hypothetical protein [Clostridiales bacterium]
MAAYTIEDIELIRRKSGISYQEAVALLDYHNGNVARALVDLERNGRLKDGTNAQQKKTSSNVHSDVNVTKSTALKWLHKCYRARVKIHREETPILNVSAIFAALSLVISPYLVVIAVIICLVLGYKFTFTKHDHAFDGENLEQTVRNAAANVKSSVNDFTKGATPAKEEEPAPKTADARSYYSSPRPEPVYRPSCPTMNVPVQVESQDGNVTIESDKDGYSSATVE